MQDLLTNLATVTEIAIASLIFLPLLYRPTQTRKMGRVDHKAQTVEVKPVEAPTEAEILLAWEPLEVSPVEQQAIDNSLARAAAKHSEPAAILTIDVVPVAEPVEAPTLGIRELKAIASAYNKANPQAKLKGWNQWTKARLIEELQALSLL